MDNIYAELARIQRELKAPKNLYNKFGNYKYRNAEGILEAVKPLLNGLALVINDEPVMVGERYYIRATATLTDGEQRVDATAYAREDEQKKGMDGCQITGACSSYARKYALNALLMIDDSKDSDDDSLSPKNPENDSDKDTQKNPQNSPGKAAVTTSTTVPPAQAQMPANGPEMPSNTPMQGETAGAFITRRIAEMKAEFPGFDFMGARAELIKAGTVPDVPSATMKLEQAQALMDAVHQYHVARKAS